MRFPLVGVLLSLLVSTSIAGEVTVPGGGVVTIIGSSAEGPKIGHGCVVEGRLLTAAHVVARRTRLRWSDMAGREGVAWVSWSSDDADVVMLETDVPVARGFERAPSAPRPGQVAQVVHFDVAKKNPHAGRAIEVEVVATAAGHISYEAGNDPYYMMGTSGGCLIVDGKAAGIVSYNWLHGATSAPGGAPVGGRWTHEAVAIYGRWSEPRP
jgi:hypothetical protein